MPPKKQPDLKAIEHAVKEVFSLVSAMSNAVARVEDAQESSVKDLDEIREETFALKSKMNDLSTSLNDAASVPGSSTNQDQSSVSVRTISRPDTLVRNKRKALKLSTKLITSVLATEFFDDNQETASLAMSNINQETCMVLNELRSRIPPKTSYNLIGDELKTEYALILEKRCKAFNVHLDKCKNSWITRWLLMYKYGNQYQGKKKIERNNDTPDPLGGSSSAPDGDIRSARTSSPVPSPAGPSTISSNFSTLATSPNSLTRSSTASSIDRMMSRSSLTRADTDLSEEQDSDDEENNEEIQELLRQLNEARARSRKGKEPERNVRRRISGP